MKRFKDFIKPLGRKLGCPIVISSEDERQNPISDVIISHIQKCKFAIADFSTRNPNVMYEIGFAHAINKKVIPICSMRRSKPRVFDIQDIPTLYFNSHKKLAADLERRARTLLKSTQ